MASGIWHLACQTYALNLIDSHGSQSRAPQLFSSSKSFRVAKSTPSSGSLPPISKRLSKPPLLSKSALFFAPLLLLSYTQGIQALTAQTSRVIEGSAPYLTFDGGRTKTTDTNSLLYIELPDGRTITPSTNTSSSTNPIMLPSGNFTFNDIHMVIPSGAGSTSLNSLISQGKWGDDDGDGQGVGGVIASGSISLDIKDKDGTTVSRGDTLSKCSAPYKVTLSSTGGSLTTQYGLPNRSTFIGGSVEYYIKPDSSGSCYFVQSVRPNLRNGTGSYAGPSNIWNPDKGFLTQSTSASSYNLNFPTTGADGLYFDLDVGGLDVTQLTWPSVTHSGIMATVTVVTANDYWISSVDRGKRVARVTLNGPEARSQWNNNYPSRITVPTLPQTFELVGRDSSGNEVRYGFVLRKWFVDRGGKEAGYNAHKAWCNSLGYELPKFKNLTNGRDHFKRYIGAGFFSEWSPLGYASSSLVNSVYWTNDSDRRWKIYVYANNGNVDSGDISSKYHGICTAP